jgi:hypothetical protein
MHPEFPKFGARCSHITFGNIELLWFVLRSVCGTSPLSCRPFHPGLFRGFLLLNLVCGRIVSLGRWIGPRQIKTKKTQIYFSVPRGNRIRDPHVCDVDSTMTPLRPCGCGNQRCYVLRIPPKNTHRLRQCFNKWDNVSVT